MLRTANTKYGKVRGINAADPRITAFKGIPFAAPPVGDLRWKAPIEPEKWDGVRDCLEFAPISLQNIPGADPEQFYSKEWNVDPKIPMSEDCLYLNVWTPANSEEDNLPVYVWFFGGAFQWGNTAEMEFDGERIARRGIVVVTVNYRINVFGFFAHPELFVECPDAPTNFGSLDQQFGLKWTYENIKAFGGNPENITIGGQSAGGGSVMSQLNCLENKRYIKKAVVESGMFLFPYHEPPYASVELAQKNSVDFLDYLGVKSVKEARELPAEYIRVKNEESGMMWWPVNDGIFQKKQYMETFYTGKILDVPMFIGSTTGEFFENAPVTNEEELVEFAKTRFKDQSGEFLRLIGYGSQNFDEMLKNTSVQVMRIPLLEAMNKLPEMGRKNPLYFYDFGPYIPGEDNPGAFHSSDLWFFFETLAKCSRPFTGVHYDLSRKMCNYLCNFIKNGDPNGVDADGTPMEKWEPYTQEGQDIMGFYDTIEPKKVTMSDLDQFFVKFLA